MHYLDLTLPSLPANLALDEALLLEAEAHHAGEVLRFWEWPTPAVVLGAGCHVSDDVNQEACRRDDVSLFRRASGGGTVLLGQGCLLFTLVLSYSRSPELHNLRGSYRHIGERVSHGLCKFSAGIELAGTSDLIIAGRKFSGSSQQRKRDFFLHHGTLLYDFDIEAVTRYLHLPRRQPEYRQGRGHDEFLTNLWSARVYDVKKGLREAWNADSDYQTVPLNLAQSLAKGKYTATDWIYRR